MSEEKYVVPTASLSEKPDEYELKVVIPGVGKEEVELHVEGKTLTLKTRAKYQDPAGFRQVAAEFERANYAMSVDLPELANAATLTAKLEDGVLTVSVKKRAETQAKKIEIH